MKRKKREKVDTILEIIKEAYEEVLLESEEDLEPEIPEGGAELEDATEEIIQKFPKLKEVLKKLMTSDYESFMKDLEWISPKPTAFRVILQNGQRFTLTWMGEGFTATIAGKDYYLKKVDEFQNALKKLAELYSETPTGGDKEEDMEGDAFDEPAGGGSSGGGGDFGDDDFGDEGDFDEPEGEDLGDEEIDFEDPAD